jgi:uncharacterized membrane protein YfcA
MEYLQLHSLFIFSALLLVVSFLYASVGHGGASGYLALMALFSFPTVIMKPTALLLNIFVSAVSFWFFKKSNHFKWSLFYPFALSSIPMAFLGGSFTIDATLYKQILGVFLAIAILRMLNVFGKGDVHSRPINLFLALLIGSVIGLFSGMIGIGGGIILSPIIILLGWGNMKEAAAVSALFIFVNSVSGIMGFTLQGGAIPENSWYFIPVALVGGTFGAIYGSTKFNMQTLKYVLSGVLIIATIKLFFV